MPVPSKHILKSSPAPSCQISTSRQLAVLQRPGGPYTMSHFSARWGERPGRKCAGVGVGKPSPAAGAAQLTPSEDQRPAESAQSSPERTVVGTPNGPRSLGRGRRPEQLPQQRGRSPSLCERRAAVSVWSATLCGRGLEGSGPGSPPAGYPPPEARPAFLPFGELESVLKFSPPPSN